MKPVGYLKSTPNGFEGEPGAFYNYVLARDGLYVWAENDHFEATVCIAMTEVRGLAPIREEVRMRHGKIPGSLFDAAMLAFAGNPYTEQFVAVTWQDGHYDLRYPSQGGSPGGVSYDVVPGTVLDIHSHGTMRAFFSHTDDRDEQGFQLYVVVGRADSYMPDALFRMGVYGYFSPLEEKDIFDV